MFGDPSPWQRYFAPLFGAPAPAATPISAAATSGIVLLVVLIGFAIAWLRYAGKAAQAQSVERLRGESQRTPAVLTNLLYVDALLDLAFVRGAMLIGTLFARVFDPHVIDGAVREAADVVRSIGSAVRSAETGLVRAYAVLLAFGAACFIAYYALAIGVPR